MQISTTVSDYIPASILTTRGDMIVRGVDIPEALPGVAAGAWLEGQGVGVEPSYQDVFDLLTNENDLLIRGAAVAERYGKLTGLYVYKNIVQAVANNTWEIFEWDGTLWDENSEYDGGNYWFAPNRDKYVNVSAGVKFTALGGPGLYGMRFYINASLRAENILEISGSNDLSVLISCNLKVLDTQHLTVEVWQNTGASRNTVLGPGVNFLTILEIPHVP